MYNKMQIAALNAYENGEFAYLLNKNQADLEDGLETCGDGLLRFIVTELSTEEGCERAVDACCRLAAAMRQLQAVQLATIAEPGRAAAMAIQTALELCDAGLIRFIRTELSTEEGCVTDADAYNRVGTAIRKLRAVQVAGFHGEDD